MREILETLLSREGIPCAVRERRRGLELAKSVPFDAASST
jgi:hypothetical protein